MSDNILEQFAIKPIVPLHLGSLDISFTQASAFMLFGAALTITLMTLSVRRKALIPGRWQNLSEILY
ncbi:MAG: F0F1 ATP synthase subunit A, partial [Alphaproteobacteria bacterium]|nr:F0F1 ATP synthase subunit A [Alphaproteobacteria bacterium]